MTITLRFVDALLQANAGISTIFDIALVHFASIVLIHMAAVEHSRNEVSLAVGYTVKQFDAEPLAKDSLSLVDVMKALIEQPCPASLDHWNEYGKLFPVLRDK
ncbi:hypothetical protein CRX59_08055 [Burkholderia thailandensis]|nr:hypothetical protein CRX59_08055 [Burkholderia thailandensis]PNE81133.1 hypothetical protein A8H34_24995 [Burkholderia thailandensis]PNE87077.1 hypothetical protein A8H30_24655 [Burkholderia thailandensis]